MATRKKAAGRKPESGYLDDIWKAIQKASKAGKTAEANRLRETYKIASEREARMAKGAAEQKNQWGRIVTKSLKTDERIAKSSGGRRANEEARRRGIESRAKALAAKQQADPRAAKEAGAARAEGRKRAAENRAKRSAAQARARRARRNAK